MSAPVAAKFVPPSIEPDAAPTMTEPKLLENIATFVQGLASDAVKEALEAYWQYKEGVLRDALDTYAASAVCPVRGLPEHVQRMQIALEALLLSRRLQCLGRRLSKK